MTDRKHTPCDPSKSTDSVLFTMIAIAYVVMAVGSFIATLFPFSPVSMRQAHGLWQKLQFALFDFAIIAGGLVLLRRLIREKSQRAAVIVGFCLLLVTYVAVVIARAHIFAV